MLEPIPFLDLQPGYQVAQSAIDAALLRVAGSGWFLLGQELAAFEAAWALHCGTAHAAGVANGLDALHLGLLALGVGPGDEVIVPSNTYIATWLAVSQCGATPVPVEPDALSFNLDATRIQAAITPRTKVVLPVHLYGQPADMDAIHAVARQHGLAVLDDCAQAHGARYKGRAVGGLADLSAWSFYPGKNLGAMGDGGAVSGGDAALLERVKVLRNYGSRIKYHNEVKGFNSRLDEIQAAVLSAKLPHLEAATAQRRVIAAQLLDGLAGADLVLPQVPTWADPAWHLFVIRHPGRDALQARLAALGVGTLIHYPVPPHLQPAYAELGHAAGDFPVAEAMHREVLSLPLWPGMSEAQVARVIAAVKASV
ncbi:dTDP-4-amino-4,6-dideoxygalactose transaminase [Paucibacter oligotrophus]|uniref:dTDP-4-amino-4,6-dideoxygalactose transaminase n=1 Tax=Roseateles oligotrophus TaxID=1769250 RepID=A0A840L8H4_9BURK|nr:DegT/DnrJ/EryC1/StrS family aminotransferase [Roseateles oligotrophus]MBB4844061.1 dTDP-4-amino-4,6-dideoxygalactose transaminase [Roseateles oligotrophus]